MNNSATTPGKQIKTIYQKKRYTFPLSICYIYLAVILGIIICWINCPITQDIFSHIDIKNRLILLIFFPFLLFPLLIDTKKRILDQPISLIFYQNGLYIEENRDPKNKPEYISWDNIEKIIFNADRKYIKIKAKNSSNLINTNNDITTIYTNSLDCPTDELLSYFPASKVQHIRIPENLVKHQFIYTYKIIFLCTLLLLELLLLHKNYPNLILNIDALSENLKITIVLIMVISLIGMNFAILYILRKILFLQKKDYQISPYTKDRNYYDEIIKIKTHQSALEENIKEEDEYIDHTIPFYILGCFLGISYFGWAAYKDYKNGRNYSEELNIALVFLIIFLVLNFILYKDNCRRK